MRPLLLFLTLLSCIFLPPLQADKIGTLTQDHREFAFSLYQVLDTSDTNLLFSPYSIATSLCMVYVGARGDTASQMEKALHLEIDRKAVAKTSSALAQSLVLKKKEENSYQLNIANAIWVDQGTFLLADFRYMMEQQFKAKLGTLNFAQSENALSSINDWISQQTQGKIPHLLDPSDINELTRLALTNAMYFQGTWVQPFDPKATRNGQFHPTPDTATTVPMMPQVIFTPYYENELMQSVALPFVGMTNGGGQLALIIILPKSADNFSAVFQELSPSFESWISSLKYQRVDLKIPKFFLSNRFDLNEPLNQLGMQDAFDSDANFTGIDGMRDLFLNKVVHQAFFDLNENGVSAAAATAASMNVKSAEPQGPPTVMHVDHPFLFFIVDLNSHEMLLMGKIVEPDNAK